MPLGKGRWEQIRKRKDQARGGGGGIMLLPGRVKERARWPAVADKCKELKHCDVSNGEEALGEKRSRKDGQQSAGKAFHRLIDGHVDYSEEQRRKRSRRGGANTYPILRSPWRKEEDKKRATEIVICLEHNLVRYEERGPGRRKTTTLIGDQRSAVMKRKQSGGVPRRDRGASSVTKKSQEERKGWLTRLRRGYQKP